MKILHIADYYMPGMGYQENFLPKWNAAQNNEVYLITGDRYYPIPDYDNSWGKVLGNRICGVGKFIENNVNFIRLPVLFEIKERPWLKNLKKQILAIKPDVIMIHGTSSFNFYRVPLIAKKLNIPCLADNHMVFHVIRKNLINSILIFIHRILIKYFYINLVHKFIGVTKETCEYLIKYEKIPKEKVFLLPLGIDDTLFNTNNPKNYNLSPNDPIIVMQTGKLSEDKKPQWLAEAVIKLLSNSINIKCLFVGGGSDKIRRYIEELFIKNEVRSRLEFIDFVKVEDLPKLYSQADICVYPNGTSLSALEAAACGSAVIMADYDVGIDRANDGLGITYETGNITDLSIKIKNLSTDEKFRKKIISTSLDSINKDYSYENISKKLLNLCNDSLKKLN